jgi:sec-independent protein translocase protein TatA
MPGLIGIPEIVVLLVVLTLVFGARRLPEIGRSLGEGLSEFKRSVARKPQREVDRAK